MVSNTSSRWTVAAATFVLWGLVAASAVYWGLKLRSTGANSAVAPPPVRMAAPSDPVAVARLMGWTPTAAAASPVASLASRFVLLGVVANSSHNGAALIAVDGRPAKPFRVGTAVDQELVLQSVDSRRATLASNANGPAVLTLELPPRK
ncbi:type II secretion system protein N [Caenimonas aquaedulcis]|uniref:General secretion pathway protein C n=1 Tax=Caenimonas aquaedulcis TaxID=2793270 RepID=A0A931MIK7_9BURK|nr:type II secretion system protein N [Caenimonas aquaedulcis]MBG9389360.1 general secretion pathway protein C [Caenimonas aquaedulcis]